MNLIIGSGRLAKHLAFYFNHLKIPYIEWSRQNHSTENLANKLHDLKSSSNSRVLLAISESEIPSFYQTHLAHRSLFVIHFSGRLHFSEIPSAHPLMSFGESLFKLSTYEKIHFVITGANSLNELLPGLKNSFSVLPPHKKSFYHAMCVLGGNLTQVLIKKMFLELEQLGIPHPASQVYIEQILINTFSDLKNCQKSPDPLHCLPSSGPLLRKDFETLNAHRAALRTDPFLKVYESFLNLYLPENYEQSVHNTKGIEHENHL